MSRHGWTKGKRRSRQSRLVRVAAVESVALSEGTSRRWVARFTVFVDFHADSIAIRAYSIS